MFNNLKNIVFAVIGVVLIALLSLAGMAVLAFLLVVFAISMAVFRFKVKKAIKRKQKQNEGDIIEVEYEIIEDDK